MSSNLFHINHIPSTLIDFSESRQVVQGSTTGYHLTPGSHPAFDGACMCCLPVDEVCAILLVTKDGGTVTYSIVTGEVNHCGAFQSRATLLPVFVYKNQILISMTNGHFAWGAQHFSDILIFLIYLTCCSFFPCNRN